MIDTSHGNSGKDFRRQPAVASVIAEQVAAGYGDGWPKVLGRYVELANVA